LHADLAEIHQPIVLDGPESAPPLDQEQREHFERHGFVSGIRILEEGALERLREELTRLVDPDHPGHDLFHEFHLDESEQADTQLLHALGAWRIEPGFHDLPWNPAFVRPARELLGGDIRLWHDQLFYKPARHGGVVAWHQDYSYWTRTEPMAHLTCWIALDDSTVGNGCLHYVPGSHRWELLPVTGLAGDMNAIQAVLNDQQRAEFRPVPIELKAGQAAFHHPLMVHGSYENTTDRPRRATVLNVFRDGTRSASDEPLLHGVPAIAKGQSLRGRFFPLLTPPDQD